MHYGKMVAPVDRTQKTLKSGVVVESSVFHYIEGDREYRYFYYQGREVAWMGITPEGRALYFNSKYLKDPNLKDIRSLIRRRAKAQVISEYMAW